MGYNEYWIEYVEPQVEYRWTNYCNLREDIVPLARAYYRYAETGKSPAECVELIVSSICEWNSFDIGPDTLDWNDLINQVAK